VASVIRNMVRKSDVAARFGGDEFVVILPGTDANGGSALAEKLRVAVAESRILAVREGQTLELGITASIGLANMPDTPPGDDLLRNADAALYAAKRAGRNRVAASAPKSRSEAQ
jgi:two-component system, cell cycle response regulator